MSGQIAVIYGRRELDGEILDAVDAVLEDLSKPLIRTRRGRVWNCTIDGRAVNVRIENTAETLWDCEDDLLKLELLPEQAPVCVVLAAGLSTAEDLRVLDSLVQRIVPVIDGVVVPHA